VHLWLADTSHLSDDLIELLSPDERARAARFARPLSGQRWAKAHGVLRALLGRYLQTDPRELRFAAGSQGKPRVLGARLSFNLSHSDTLVLCAFSGDRPVGVDIQVARRRVDEAGIAARTLGAEQAARLKALSSPDRQREFMRLWTRHEAQLKCLGTGLGASRPHDAAQLWVVDLGVGPGATAALASARPPRDLRHWAWSG